MREIGVRRKPEDALDDRRQDRLGEQFFVFAGPREREILTETRGAVQLPEATTLLIEHRDQTDKLFGHRRGRHQNCGESVKRRCRMAGSSEVVATVPDVAPPGNANVLTPEELEALRSAGAWYAKYHVVRVAEMADDPSAYAEGRREKFLTLVAGLRKLGFDMALPDELRSAERQAA